MAKHENDDWKDAELRKAAVEYAFQAVGVPPKAAAHYEHYRGRLVPVAKALGLTGEEGVPGAADLLAWCRDKDLRPSAHLPGETGVDEDMDGEESLTLAAMDAEAVAGGSAGVLPAAVADPLEALLGAESGHLSEREKQEIAAALDAGAALSRSHRLALAALLRGTQWKSRADVIRQLLDFLAGPDLRKTVWESRDSMAAIPAGGSVRVEEMGKVVPGFRKTGRQRLLICDAAGSVVKVLLYARVRVIERGKLWFTRLVPAERFSDESMGMRAGLLYSWVCQDGLGQKGWARLFGKPKQNANYHGQQLDKQFREATGEGMRARNMRHKPQANKGGAQRGGRKKKLERVKENFEG